MDRFRARAQEPSKAALKMKMPEDPNPLFRLPLASALIFRALAIIRESTCPGQQKL